MDLVTEMTAKNLLYSGSNHTQNLAAIHYFDVFKEMAMSYTIQPDYFDGAAFIQKIKKDHQLKIIQENYNLVKRRGKKILELQDGVYVISKHRIMVAADIGGSWRDSVKVFFSKEKTDRVVLDKIVELSKQLSVEPRKKVKKRGRIYTLTVIGTGMKARVGFKAFSIKDPMVHIEKNYNNDFQEVHHRLVSSLGQKEGKGIAILHGLPGTGKTNYIRHLARALKKKVLFISPAMAHYMTDPGFMSMLLKHKNSVLIIEDCGTLLKKRLESTHDSASTILNLSDGLLWDVLKMQVVVTFNIPLSQIDEAFLRNGRLICEYEFGELTTEKADQLSESLGFAKLGRPALLGDIYNQEREAIKSHQGINKIGFRKK